MNFKEIKEKVKGMGMRTFAIVAVLATIATATLVTYLSSPAVINANVQSPFALLFVALSQGTISPDQLSADMGTVYGGSQVFANATIENRANAAVTGYTRMGCGDCDATIKRKRYDWDGTQYNYVNSLTMSCTNGTYEVANGNYAAGYKALYAFEFDYPSTFFGSSVCSIQTFPS